MYLYVLLVAHLVPSVEPAAFGLNNLVVLQTSSASLPQGSPGVAVAFVELTPAGTSPQTISLASCVLGGNSPGEGMLSSSFDGTLATVGCYIAAVGATPISSSTGVVRAVQSVDNTGALLTIISVCAEICLSDHAEIYLCTSPLAAPRESDPHVQRREHPLCM